MASQQIDEIKEMLGSLSEDTLKEIRDFIAFLAEKERKRKVFVERIHKIEAESDTVTFNSVKDAMEPIRNCRE